MQKHFKFYNPSLLCTQYNIVPLNRGQCGCFFSQFSKMNKIKTDTNGKNQIETYFLFGIHVREAANMNENI